MKRDWHSEEFRVMMTLGASITAGGWSSCRDRCWASQLTRIINEFQNLPVQLVNLGIGGNVLSPRSAAYRTSQKPAAAERLDQHVLNYTANGNHLTCDLLVVAYGLNDARGGTAIDVFGAEMKDILGRVRTQIQPLIVLLGPYYISDFNLGAPNWNRTDLAGLQQYNQAIRALAHQQQCLFVDLLAAYDQTDWMVHQDGVHANDLGHRVIAHQIFNVLARNCSCLARRTKELENHITPWRDESTL